jgi:serine/threonine protein kinase
MQHTLHSLKKGHVLINQYELVSVLGTGGFGITYLAYDKTVERNVAIKEYLPTEFAARDTNDTIHALSTHHTALYDKFKDGFLNEAKVLAKFKNSAIVRVINFFEANGTAYIVMEFEEGSDLREYLDKHTTLTETEILSLARPLLEGLSVLHTANLVHRDIKPANIYLREDGSPVLLDFGAARQTIASQTKNLTSFLTPGYSPVEQYQTSITDQGPWSDIYAMAAVFYEMISGKKPTESNSRILAIQSGKDDPVEKAEIIGKGQYSTQFLQAIDHGLQVMGQLRPQTIKEWELELIGINNPESQQGGAFPKSRQIYNTTGSVAQVFSIPQRHAL